MKRYNVVLILCILLFFCSCGEKNEDIQGNNGTLSIFIEDYELQIPCDWMIKSVYSYQKADQPVLQVDVLDFDEEQLKQEYGYQSKEECLVHFMPNGVYEQERKEAEAADHLKGWQLNARQTVIPKKKVRSLFPMNRCIWTFWLTMKRRNFIFFIL